MKMLRIIFSISVFIAFAQLTFGQQATIKGTVFDKKSNETMIGVNVIADSLNGTTTNIDGKYELKLKAGKYELKFSFIGYKTITKSIDVKAGETITTDMRIEQDYKELELVVVSGSLYEKRIGEEVTSMEVLKSYLVENSNAPTLSQAVEKVPGVTIVDGQASIRGGAGYAYGAGSRVAVMVDDLPLLSGDLNEVRWNFVPIEHVEQIEVIKGASSSIYGSGALNGVIHVRTGWAYDKPQSNFSIYQGVYSSPRRKELKWWDNYTNPFFTGAFFSHRQRFGNLDVVAGGNVNSESSFRQGASDQQIRLNFKTRYKSEKIKGLSFGLNGNYMYQQFGRFFLWQDADAGAYKPMGGYNTGESTISKDRYAYITIDPHVTYTTEKEARHSLRSRYYNVTRYETNGPGTTASSNLIYNEYQFHKKFKHGFYLTAGTVLNHTFSYSNLYNDLTFKTYFGALYAQAEKKIGNFSMVAGLRDELSIIGNLPLEHSKPALRAGANYQFGKATFLRASWGQGYRFPSIGERFIDENLGAINIFPNPNLRPEKGWTGEIGVKQGLKISKWMGYVDASFFWTEFRNMTEFTFTVNDKGFGFQSQNVSKARIAGVELSTIGEGKIGSVPVRLLAGYTFIYPADLESDTSQSKPKVFLTNLFQSFSSIDSLQASILKYRMRNVARADMEFDIRKFTFGGSMSYISFMDRIDGIFEVFIPGVKEFRVLNNKGFLTFDVRSTFRISEKSTLTFLVKNLTNLEYSLRPGLMEGPRNYTVQFRVKF